MSDPTEQRKLAAIMFTDMVGYSALSQRDDKLALELLEEHRRLLREIFPRFHGTEIKTIGDAFLVEFNSALEAAQCAIEIQRALGHRNHDVPAERHIELKIGIHIGDVVHRGGDVYGDGVNIASRIEQLAGAGGICVSMDVERQIRNAVETRFEKLAATELKNISVPMELFRIVLPWERQAKAEVSGHRSEDGGTGVSSARSTWMWKAAGVAVAVLVMIGAGWWWSTRKPLPTRSQTVSVATDQPANIAEKSIAVLPFDNLSSDKENAYFAEGIQDEILTRLSKIAALKVISRSSTQRYKSAPDNLRDVGKQLGVANLLEGSVQKVANAVHVNVQLIRAANDEHLWAESYNRKLDDVFGVEGEVASAIADQLKTKLSGAEQKAVAEKPTQNAAAYDVYLHAVAIDDAATLDVTKQVVPLYAETVRLDPQFALAWARLSIARSQLYFNGIDLETNTGAKVKEEADRAIALQPELGEAWLAQGVYRYRVLRDFQGALQSYEEALRRLPNSAFVLEQMGHLERRLGQFDAAQKHYEVAVQLDPRNIGILSTVADTLQSLRRFDEAQTMLDRVLEISPGNESVLARKAAIFQGQGRLKEAAEVLAKIPANSKEDDVTIQRFVQLYDERQFDEAIAYVQHNMPPSLANDPRTITFLGICQKLSGKTNEVRNTFTRAVAAFKPTPDAVVPIDARQLPCYLALAYAYLGEKDKALEQARQAVSDYATDALSKPLAEAYLAIVQAQFGDIESGIAALPHLLEVPNGETAGDLRINPLWDPLRNDPRFQKLSQEK